MLKKIILGAAICLSLVFSIQQNCLADELPNRQNQNHFLDLGIGLGLDYGGILGAKIAYIFPFPYISVFGSIGAQALGMGWNVGTTFHVMPENDKSVFRLNFKIMYGINRFTMVAGASEYNKMFAGWTPGAGLEFMFGRKKANGFDIDINYPIGSTGFNDQVNKMKADPRIGKMTMSSVALSIGYHHEF